VTSPLVLKHPQVIVNDGALRSVDFNDVYFHASDGLAETRHVFLTGIGAPDIWRNRSHFVIGETGFGSGLNFLATWHAWRATAPQHARLHYVAVEGFPLARQDLAQSLKPWPELEPLADALIAAWPLPIAGFHPLEFDHGRVRLTLLFGEAGAALHNLTAKVDAWYLDGFAPDRNPTMWRDEVMAEIARLSVPGARLASFTVAGAVRRALERHGFAIDKAPGFGRKRESLRGRFEGPAAARDAKPWFAPPASVSPRHVAVVGGGIAGFSVAQALRSLDAEVTVVDAGNPAAMASGNPAAVEPWLDLGGNAAARAHLIAFLDAVAHYRALNADIWQECGVLRLLTTAAAQKHAAQATVLLPPNMVHQVAGGDVAGVPVSHDGLLIPLAGMVLPGPLLNALADGVALRPATVTRLQNQDGRWALLDEGGTIITTADAVVVAAALATRALAGLPSPLEARAGEVTFLPPTAATQGVQTVLSYGGYLTPAVPVNGDRAHMLGATFDVVDADNPVNPRPNATERNIAGLRKVLPQLGPVDTTACAGRASVRATTTDHLPIVGAVPDMDFYAQAYAGLRHGKRGAYEPARYKPGLYVLTALGARGFCTAPLLAKALAAEIMGLPVPVERAALDAFHAARFCIKELKRRRS
jgi:tRNA 5-methylaminomethyl-2-thiouridine biosynthesis bifunctional protein